MDGIEVPAPGRRSLRHLAPFHTRVDWMNFGTMRRSACVDRGSSIDVSRKLEGGATRALATTRIRCETMPFRLPR
jgi:hypothetical protein